MKLWRINPRSQQQIEAAAREFMPAAIELEQAPASSVARWILWSIMLFFVAAVIWATVGKVDVVSVAEGSLVPTGRTKTIQPAHLGRVAEIHVQDGDRVIIGQPLITLDGTETLAEVDRLQQAYNLRARRADRLGTWIQHIEAGLLNSGVNGVVIEASPVVDPLLESRLQALKVRDATLRQRKAATAADLARVHSHVRRLERTLPLLREHADAVRTLSEQSMASRIQRLELEREVIDSEGQLEAERHRLDQLAAELGEIEQQRRQLWSDALEDALTEQENVKAELEDLEQELIKANSANQQQVLRAPVDGIVHNLQLNTLSGVVQPAQTVVEIIPEEERVIAEVWVLNRDIGFVRKGQDASLKVSAFSFTRYGTVPGKVVHVSSDAVVDENAGARYLARIELDRDYIDLGGTSVNLSPGMTVTAEVITDKRRLIEFFAAPIAAALNEAGRER